MAMRRNHGLLLPAAFLAVLSAPGSADAGNGFSRRLELQGVKFDVSATNEGSINQLTIVPHGLHEQRGPVTVEIDGTVSGAEIADLDANGFPEIYIYVTSAGSGSYGSLVGYAVNNNKSMTGIHLPPIADDAKHNSGYMGHDEFAVVEGTFVQRFPIYGTMDSNAQPSGKTRQLQYKLKAGEAGWVLRIDKAIEY
ncbi:PliI family lysozyme inhibitor of I-type lysozyme [Aestuariivirga sp.]|uniref:PliI family lysozyme inhibitor of I-type lysozyme n=1 Tax=Aestuariivirga sp. TaxID=2650926 RepID=UPI0025BB2C2B|nr:PliI family lysozyme inhibitor of I-type lysozyme [Aestuariivirga sp.]MCA3556219.1 PliI family lysozyme inhibitor of I-type lysozyme [Aestuariivirga sp.]